MEEAKNIPSEDIQSLSRLVNDMDRLLNTLQRDFSSILNSIPKNDIKNLPALINEVGKKQDVSKSKVEKAIQIFDNLDKNGDLLAYIQKTLQEQILIERKQLADKIEIIKSGGYKPGDMSRKGKCALGWACIGAGALLEAWPVAAVGVALVAENCDI